MENTTTTEPVSEEAATQQKRVVELRQVQPRLLPRSQKSVGVRALQEYLLERQRPEETPRKHLKCKLLQATETIEKFKEKTDKQSNTAW
ncbi:MAG: hypothetical protein ACKPKO_58000 [Candidatus Fonsibacter sp.]